MKIGIDISGGDHAPDANIDGVILALKELPLDVILVLIGDVDEINPKLEKQTRDNNRVELVHASEKITMHDHPTTVIRKKNKKFYFCRLKPSFKWRYRCFC
jgi:glycerol-3-phosphate acyltransferase PlsX